MTCLPNQHSHVLGARCVDCGMTGDEQREQAGVVEGYHSMGAIALRLQCRMTRPDFAPPVVPFVLSTPRGVIR